MVKNAENYQLGLSQLWVHESDSGAISGDAVGSSSPRSNDRVTGRHSVEVRRHELSELLGGRDPKDLGRLREAMRAQQIIDNQTVVEVETLEGKVLWDWDRFLIARELGMRVQFTPYDAGDPVAYLCIHALHTRQWSRSQKAVLVVAMCRWAGHGRPKKSTHSAGFSHESTGSVTTEMMATMAGVSSTTISQAKAVHAAGFGADVLDGSLGFAEAYRRARKAPEIGLNRTDVGGANSPDNAFQRGVQSERQPARTKPHSREVLEAQVRDLERARSDLMDQILLLEAENDRQRSAAAAADAALERERRRADAAEAEVARLRSVLADTGRGSYEYVND